MSAICTSWTRCQAFLHPSMRTNLGMGSICSSCACHTVLQLPSWALASSCKATCSLCSPTDPRSHAARGSCSTSLASAFLPFSVPCMRLLEFFWYLHYQCAPSCMLPVPAKLLPSSSAAVLVPTASMHARCQVPSLCLQGLPSSL